MNFLSKQYIDMKHIKGLFGRETFLRITLPVLLVAALAVIAITSLQKPEGKNLAKGEVVVRAENFINNYLMQSGTKATIQNISEEYGLYKLEIDIVSDVVESYISKDGKFFFPQAMNIDDVSGSGSITNPSGGSAPIQTVSVKSDKPTVELFVMSHCPFGTQIEKGMLPVLDTLGDKIDFELKFVDYAMHGEKELKEQINQHCIQKEQSDKLSAYLKCFLIAGDGPGCLTSTGINESQLNTCYTQTDQEFKIMDNFKQQIGYQGSYPGFDIHKADNLKYGVVGSPTLIINGQEVSSGRDSASLLSTICTAFNNAPEECQTILPSASPAPGFGSGTVAASNMNAECAPIQ